MQCGSALLYGEIKKKNYTRYIQVIIYKQTKLSTPNNVQKLLCKEGINNIKTQNSQQN